MAAPALAVALLPETELTIESTTAPVDPQHLGPEANAEKRYLRVLEIDLNAVVAANNVAWLYAEQDKNLDAALDRAQRAKRSLAADPRINDTLGWVYYKKKLLDQAVVSLEESVKRDANNPLHQYHLGMAYVQTGDWPQARQALKRALQTPDFSGASDARKPLTMRLMACGPLSESSEPRVLNGTSLLTSAILSLAFRSKEREMAGNITIRAELQEQRRFIEEQRLELQRQQREIAVQFRRTADMQAELDGLKAMLLRQGANLRSTKATPSNGNGHHVARRTKLSSGVANE